jgi:hypothetical protein
MREFNMETLNNIFKNVYNSVHFTEDNPKAYATGLHNKVLGSRIIKHQNCHSINYVEFNIARCPIDTIIVNEKGNIISSARDFSNLVIAAYHELFPNENVEDEVLRRAAEDYFARKNH